MWHKFLTDTLLIEAEAGDFGRISESRNKKRLLLRQVKHLAKQFRGVYFTARPPRMRPATAQINGFKTGAMIT